MPTYELIGARAICCRLCGFRSVLPADLANRYCGQCHLFHDVVAEARRLVAAGGTHDCGEWRTALGACALCGDVE
jgi:hypothetical protein